MISNSNQTASCSSTILLRRLSGGEDRIFKSLKHICVRVSVKKNYLKNSMILWFSLVYRLSCSQKKEGKIKVNGEWLVFYLTGFFNGAIRSYLPGGNEFPNYYNKFELCITSFLLKSQNIRLSKITKYFRWQNISESNTIWLLILNITINYCCCFVSFGCQIINIYTCRSYNKWSLSNLL